MFCSWVYLPDERFDSNIILSAEEMAQRSHLLSGFQDTYYSSYKRCVQIEACAMGRHTIECNYNHPTELYVCAVNTSQLYHD